jgi:hypothetical protein
MIAGRDPDSYRQWQERAPCSVPWLTLTPRRTAAGVQPFRGLTLVAPGGYRVEGLTVETAAALLKALA